MRASRAGAGRTLVVTALVVLFAAHLSTQAADFQANLTNARAVSARYRAAADDLHRLGLRPPCLITGKHAPPIAYYTGCASANVSGNNLNTTPAAVRRRAVHEPTAALSRRHHTPPYARTWTAHHLPGTELTAHVPPHLP